MNFIFFGAHPDDCEFCAGGTAVKLLKAGHRVKFVSITNGDAGHMWHKPGRLAAVRRREAQEAAAALGVAWEVLGYHDARLEPSVEVRGKLAGLIRAWRANIVACHRPNDYHPDHRAAGQVIQDTAYMALVPLFNPKQAALPDNPVYLYYWDRFRSPEPFRPDVIVPIDEELNRKIEALHRMPSQMYEWLPWTMHVLDQVPASAEERKAFIKEFFLRRHPGDPFREELISRYGQEAARRIEFYEAFQLCEYGRQPSPAELHALFPGLPKRIDL